MASINVKPTLKLDTAQKMPPPSNPDNHRPVLKLNTGSRQPSFSGDVGTPTPSGEGGLKIKIRLSSQPTTPAAVTPRAPTPILTKSKAGRTSKPSAKLIESKKREYESDEDQPLSESRQESGRPSKLIKIKHSNVKSAAYPSTIPTPVSTIKFKPRGEPVEHHPGDAYDSEASDREADPVREQTFILRVQPGSSVEYLDKVLSEGLIGVPKQNGGADFNIQFLDAKQRRAMVTINSHNYAAVLVHLPTITEAMKTWDRKNMMKNSDITEMLLCFEEVKNEAEAKTVPLPPQVVKNNYKWPHGLTPPMHDAANRRFRKTLSEQQWQDCAAKVAKLLEDDENAMETTVDWVDEDDDDDDDEDEDEDADGEAEQDYFGQQPGTQNAQDARDIQEEEDAEDELLLAMEAELEKHVLAREAQIQAEAATPMSVDANTPAAPADEVISEEDEDDESEEEDEEEDEDEDEDEDGEDVDEEQLVAERERKEKLDEIEHLKKTYEDTQRQLTEVTAPILKKRLLTKKANLEKEIAVKKAALGLADED
ncbi:TAFII55 protein conserved region-domain-containing protein [Hypoxylon sp. NC1633]|nr:TAFII55 protein conserved region-domain-containing protein [Hypoxylon sp. NC1633]